MFSSWNLGSKRDDTNNDDEALAEPPLRRHTTPNLTANLASESQDDDQKNDNNIASTAASTKSITFSPVATHHRIASMPTTTTPHSERARGSSPTALIRERSQTDYSTSAMKFLRVVDKIQKIKRIEKMLRQSSAPALVGGGGASTPGGGVAAVGETTPLVGSDPQTPVPNSARSTKSLLSSSNNTFSTPPPPPPSGGVSNRTMSSDVAFSSHSSSSIREYFFDLFFGKGIVSALLLVGPVALWSVYQEWSATYVFWLNFLVMIPLASILGDFTEEVALHTNQTIGGLINATFGNAVEVVLAIQALMANEIRVVQSSMLGSIFSNLLLVLGGCFFFGGLKYKEQSFNTTAATANMALLALSGIALVLPTPFASYYDLHDEHVLFISRLAAIFLLFMYLQLLVFQLKTHADLFEDTNNDQNDGGEMNADDIKDNADRVAQEEEEEEEVELASIPFWMACAGLLGTTLGVTYFSEMLVDSIDGFVQDSGISRTFVGLILLPIVGNAVEHVTAITVARKDKMDLAMGVAVGSCTQISLFVVPLTVLVGWVTDRDMTLNFPHFEIILFVLSVFTVSVVLSSPKCNWLEGSLLMTTYLLIAVGFWFEKITTYEEQQQGGGGAGGIGTTSG